MLQPFVCDINSSEKHYNSGKIIFSVYSAVNHNVYLFMIQTYLHHFPKPFQSKSTPAFHFLNPLICSNGALFVIDFKLSPLNESISREQPLFHRTHHVSTVA